MKRAFVLLLLLGLTWPAAARAQAHGEPGHHLVAGDVVAPFEAQGLDGATHKVDFPKGSRTVLLFFLSSCPTCHRMIPLWNEWYTRRPKDLRVVAVMLDREPPGFFDIRPVAFPVLRSPGPAFGRAMKVNHVPMTVRVGPGGTVEDAAEGVIDAIRLGQLFRP